MEFENYLCHHGVKGQKWGVRRYQNEDGSLTSRGRARLEQWGINMSSSATTVKNSISNKIENTKTSITSKKASSTSTKKKTESSDSKTKDETGTEKKKLTTKQKVAIGVGVGAAAAATAAAVYTGVKTKQLKDGNGYESLALDDDKIQDFCSGKHGKTKVKDLVNQAKTAATGQQYCDTYINEGVSFKRIQTSDEFGKYEFYATYKKSDSDKYMGLYGKNLKDRAVKAAEKAEEKAKKTGLASDSEAAKALRETANNTHAYQVGIKATKKLKVPSEQHASEITAGLLKDKDFHSNALKSIQNTSKKMKRPSQQAILKQAERAMKKDPDSLTKSEKTAIYKAFNLSLTYHDDYHVASQKTFYDAMKKAGYGAILDINDKSYSSYHAKRPMIVFDMDGVSMDSITEVNSKVAQKLNTKYNTERMLKEIPEQTLGTVSKYGKLSLDECSSYMERKIKKHLSN